MRILLLIPLLLLGCSRAPDEVAGLRSGAFSYSARNAAGQPILTGRLELAFPSDSTVTGTWTITWVAGADTVAQVGPQVGSGSLVGSRRGDTLLIQLNPTYADNNVSLFAAPNAEGYAGSWEWSTISGPASGGAIMMAPE